MYGKLCKQSILPISLSTVFNSSALRLCRSWINWLALNLALVCLFKNFLWSLFSKQSQWSSFLVLVAWSKWRSSRFRHAEIFHKPFLFKTHLNFWNIWQGAWNLGFKHSTAKISWVVNFLTNGLLELELVILVNWSICVRILAQRSSVILPLSIKNACLQLGAGSTVTSSLKKKRIELITLMPIWWHQNISCTLQFCQTSRGLSKKALLASWCCKGISISVTNSFYFQIISVSKPIKSAKCQWN